MLETLMQIGKTLRSAGKMKHHRYISQAPLANKKSPVCYLSLPVDKDFNIDINGLTEIHDETFIRNKLYYLTFKSSDTDSLVKYIFGDISYGINKNGEVGYYKMSNPKIKNLFGISSFYRAKKDAEIFKGSAIEPFRNSFESHIEKIEDLLKEYGNNQRVYLHFDFAGKHWYELTDELNAINQKLLTDFLGEQDGKYILRKFLYKTLIPSTSQSPGFNMNNLFKTKAFQNHDEVLNLLYSIDYSSKSLINDRNIKIIVLPKGNNLEADQIEEFFTRRGIEDEEAAEVKIVKANKNIAVQDYLDSLFEPILIDVAENITQFDLIFSKKSASGPDIDMIELSGIEKSFLKDISDRVKTVRNNIYQARDSLFQGSEVKLGLIDIRRSFLNILGDVTKEKKKYQSHLLKVLPQIYTNTYYRDDVILPAFIEKTEFNIRNDSTSFNLIKFDYYFLVNLQNRNGEDLMEEMKSSKSYQMGLLLGKMAQPLTRKINSFEKNYVGLLSRRISDKKGLITLANFINEKLAIHNVAYTNLKQAFTELAALVSEISDKDYNKNYCAFGFFESYFAKLDLQNKPQTDELSSSNE